MAERAPKLRSYGGVFDGVAAEYDAARPGYSPELVDAAVKKGALDRDSSVLEIGCGTGKLTELLVKRGLHVRRDRAGRQSDRGRTHASGAERCGALRHRPFRGRRPARRLL